jgi:hypothetical protein
MAPQPRHSSGRFLPKPVAPPDLQPGPAEPGPRDTYASPNPGGAAGGRIFDPASGGSRGGGLAQNRPLRPMARSPRPEVSQNP